MKWLTKFNKRHRRSILYFLCLCLCLFPIYLIGMVHDRSLLVNVFENTNIIKTADPFFLNSTDLSLLNDWLIRRNGSFQNNYGHIFLENFTIQEPTISKWLQDSKSFCDGKFTDYSQMFAHLRDVTLDPAKNMHINKGGEDIEKVKNQPENAEYLALNKGYFKMTCSECVDKLNYKTKEAKTDWLKNLECSNNNLPMSPENVIKKYVIAIQRYEYVNVYHTMTDWYNAFLLTLVLKQKPENITILWMDGHPKGSLDTVWWTLFGSAIQAGRVQKQLLFRNLIWSMDGYHSFLNKHSLNTIPYTEEFRYFFLKRFNVTSPEKLECGNLKILFSFRHDYIAHPRNMKGVIKRKMKNEGELVTSIRESFPGYKVAGIQLDSLSFEKQLQFIVNSDILIGMHGAGMTMSLFLPKHAGLIELYPSYFSTNNVHFKSIAKWRNLKYKTWQNRNNAYEYNNFETYIPPNIIRDFIKQIVTQMCNKTVK